MKKLSPNTRRLGLLLAVPAVLAIMVVIGAVNSNSDTQA